MASVNLTQSEFLEVISYDLFVTAIGFSVGGELIRFARTVYSGTDVQITFSVVGTALLLSAGLLGILALFLWRLSQSTAKR